MRTDTTIQNPQDARADRALDERFIFTPRGDGSESCYSVASRHYYRVSETGCTCPDQAQRPELVCKHRVALAIARAMRPTPQASVDTHYRPSRAAAIAPAAPQSFTPAERDELRQAARRARNIDLDF